MHRPKRLLRSTIAASIVALASGVACSGGSGEPSSIGASSIASGGEASAATGDLAVPANTIVADTAGVLPPTGSGSLNAGERGEAHLHIPIWVPPGRAGIQPELSLEYSSTGGNGLVGTGWGIAGLPRITRCKNMRKNGAVAPPILWYYADSFCLDGEELVGDSDHYFYRKFHDDGSLLVHASTPAADGGAPFDSWQLRSKDDRIVTFGGRTDSRVTVSNTVAPQAIMTWALSDVQDRAGNFLQVSYKPAQGGDIKPQEIDYTGSSADPTTRRSIVFFYDPTQRPDVDQKVVAGQALSYFERLARLEMHAPNSAGLDPVRTFSFGYTISPTTGRSLLSSIAECDGPAPSSIPVVGSTPLCRQEAFTYAPGSPVAASNSFVVSNTDSTGAPITDVSEFIVEGVGPTIRLLDVDADGRDDLLYLPSGPDEHYSLRLSTGTTFGPVSKTDIPVSIPAGIGSTGGSTSPPIVLDFNGDGHADVLVNQGPPSAPVAHLYLANDAQGYWTLGGGSTYEESLWSGYSNYQSADLNGDGLPDLIMLQGGVAWFSLNLTGLFTGTTAPAVLPMQANTDYSDNITNYFVDFNNDGVTDIMTRVWADSACVGRKFGELDCTCQKMSYGALDIGKNLYSGYPGGSGVAATGVYGLVPCTGALDAMTQHVPLFGDFNGDGVVDVVQTWVPNDGTTNPPMTLQLSLGGGNQEFLAQSAGSLTLPNPGALAFQTIDANLDGKMDLLVRGTGVLPYTVYSWQNQKWQSATLPIGEDPVYYAAMQSVFASGDVNGDSLPDFVAYAGAGNNPLGQLTVYLRQMAPLSPRADLLTSAKGDFGPTATVRYAPYLSATNPAEDRTDCQTPLACVTRGGWLVSEVDVDNGIGGTNAQHHSFGSGRIDLLGWGPLGFKTHTIVDDATGAVTTRKFDLSASTSGATPFYPYLGMPTEVDTSVVYQSAGQPVTRKTVATTVYTVQGAGPFMTLPDLSQTVTTDSNVGTPIASTIARRSYDAWGNKTYEVDLWPLDSEQQTTTITYLDDANQQTWIIGRPAYVSTTSTTASGAAATREVAYIYDSLGQLAVQIDNPGAADNGSYDPLPTQSDGVQTLYTRITRDPNGMPTLVEKLDTLSAPTQRRATGTRYDATEGMYVVQTTDPVGLVTRTAYEPALGVLAAQTDPAGVLTTYQYDTFGRVRADHPAAGADRAVTYHAATPGNFGSTEDHRLGQYDNVSALDSLKRTVATIKTGRADGRAVSTETTYDALGRVQATTRPHFAGVTPAQSTTTYDNLGRVTQLTGADGSVQTTSYLGLAVTTTNPDGNVSTVTSDSRGRAVTSVQATVTGSAGLSGHVTTTTLGYGPFGVLSTSTDTLGDVVTTIYDRLGRPHIRMDRDAGGASGFGYDVFGELTDETRGAGVVFLNFGGKVTIALTGGVDTVSTFDGDGRVLTKTAPDVAETYTWDGVHPGKLSGASVTGGTSIAYSYDAFGNIATKTWNGPRGAIGYKYAYDKYNRLSTTTYPPLPLATKKPALVVKNTYSGGDVGGQLTEVDDVTTASSPSAYWKLRSTDASESFPVVDLANGVESTFGEDPSHPGWLHTIASTAVAATVQSLAYGREGAGRVHERDDALNGTTETFGYDGLERLTSWTWQGQAGARGVQYVYDDIGNLQQRNVTAGPGTSVTYTYGTNGMGPHQASGDGSATAYAYDHRGNQTVAPGRSFAFNSFDRPTSVTASAGTYAMTYDADFARFSRTDPAGNVRTSYGGLFEEFTDSAGTHDVMTIPADGRTVAEVEKVVHGTSLRSTTVSTVLIDALGSTDVLVGSDHKPQAIKYDPFGARVQASDPAVHVTSAPRDLRVGFTGHEQDDDVDLIDMIGRVYDPVQQRFLSLDPPLPDRTDGQAYNPYAYVRNNPLNATDPTGYLEVVLEGVPFGTNDEDAYTQAPGAAVTLVDAIATTTYVIPYGDLPGEIQGTSGTEGPGASASSGAPAAAGDDAPATTPEAAPGSSSVPGSAPAGKPTVMNVLNGKVGLNHASDLDLDPLDRMARPDPTRNAFLLSAMVLFESMADGVRATPEQIARFTESILDNHHYGTCEPAGQLNALLGLMNGYRVYVNVIYNSPKPTTSHAVTTLADGGRTWQLSWGVTSRPSLYSIASYLNWGNYYSGDYTSYYVPWAKE
jgi:RHS repeat-associated protein